MPSATRVSPLTVLVWKLLRNSSQALHATLPLQRRLYLPRGNVCSLSIVVSSLVPSHSLETVVRVLLEDGAEEAYFPARYPLPPLREASLPCRLARRCAHTQGYFPHLVRPPPSPRRPKPRQSPLNFALVLPAQAAVRAHPTQGSLLELVRPRALRHAPVA